MGSYPFFLLIFGLLLVFGFFHGRRVFGFCLPSLRFLSNFFLSNFV